MFSALPLKADMTLRTRYVRFVPRPAVRRRSKGHPLVDRLVGEDQDRIRDRQPDRLRGSEIDDHVELRGLFHG